MTVEDVQTNGNIAQKKVATLFDANGDGKYSRREAKLFNACVFDITQKSDPSGQGDFVITITDKSKKQDNTITITKEFSDENPNYHLDSKYSIGWRNKRVLTYNGNTTNTPDRIEIKESAKEQNRSMDIDYQNKYRRNLKTTSGHEIIVSGGNVYVKKDGKFIEAKVKSHKMKDPLGVDNTCYEVKVDGKTWVFWGAGSTKAHEGHVSRSFPLIGKKQIHLKNTDK